MLPLELDYCNHHIFWFAFEYNAYLKSCIFKHIQEEHMIYKSTRSLVIYQRCQPDIYKYQVQKYNCCLSSTTLTLRYYISTYISWDTNLLFTFTKGQITVQDNFTKYRKCKKYRIQTSLNDDEPHSGLWPHYTLMGRFSAIGPITY